MPRARKPAKDDTSQAVLGATNGGVSNPAAPHPRSQPLPRAVPPDQEYVGGHGTFIELRAIGRRGDRECRVEHCQKCGVDAPHEYVCLQPTSPRVWGYSCTHCRREHADHGRA